MGITRKTIQALQGLPFDNLIGGPLNACVRAQADAAQTTLGFIQSVGLEDDENGNKKAVYVYFSFVQGGRKAVMSVPLLTIVPIPYIAINTIDINFKATVTGVESSSFTEELSEEYHRDQKTGKLNIWKAKATSIKTSLSSKKDSKSTSDSSFSIESTIDVAVHASQDSMPAGMAKILEMLGSAMDLLDPNGELSVNATEFLVPAGANAEVVAQYKTPQGIFSPEQIKCEDDGSPVIDKASGTATFKLPVKKEGSYRIKVDENIYQDVWVRQQA